jgi:hypothetical protein
MLKSSFSFILVILLLSACATPAPGIKVVVQKVEVPVAMPCKVVVPDLPRYNFDSLTVDDDIFIKNKALLADRLLHLGYENELSVALISCIK